MNMYDQMAKQAAGIGGSLMQYQPSLREQLETRKANLSAELERVNSALSFLDENANFETGVNLLRQAIGY